MVNFYVSENIVHYYWSDFRRSVETNLGEWSEKLAGIVLGLLGIWILIDAIRHIA